MALRAPLGRYGGKTPASQNRRNKEGGLPPLKQGGTTEKTFVPGTALVRRVFRGEAFFVAPAQAPAPLPPASPAAPRPKGGAGRGSGPGGGGLLCGSRPSPRGERLPKGPPQRRKSPAFRPKEGGENEIERIVCMAIKPRTLSGFMELLPAPQVQMERIMEILRKTYSLYGFTPLDTPAIEAAEVLLAKGGGETEKQIYRFQKGDSDLALRFDLTVPLAKYVALHYGELSFPFRRYQIGKVYRGERAQRGRFREFYQADIDIIGDGKLDIVNEAEIPSIIYKTFTALGLKRFQIRVNNRKVLSGFYQSLGLEGQSGDIMRTVDKLEKIGPEKVGEILTEDLGLSGEQAKAILDFMAITGTNQEVLSALEGYRGRSALLDQGLEELSAVTRYLAAFGVPQENFAVDLTIARGLDYYTGTVYETQMLDHPEIGSICSGGRYDNLAEYYIEKQLPGVGISIGLTRLFYVLGEQGLLNPSLNTAPADALILPMTQDLTSAIQLATRLREQGIRTQLYCEQKKFKAKMSYADKLGIPYALFLGEDEIAANACSVKDMRTGEQQMVSVEEAAGLIRQGLDARGEGTVIVEG